MPSEILQTANAASVSFNAPSHPIASSPRATLWHILSHFTPGTEISERIYTDPSLPEPGDKALAERIMNAFHRTIEFESANIASTDIPKEGVWEGIKHAFHGEVYGLLGARDTDGLAAHLRNAARQTITHGLGPGRQVFEALASPGEGQDANVLILLDRLASLAEAVGALPQENPEQGRYGEALAMRAEDICYRIELASGIKAGRTPVMGNFGIIVQDRVIDVRVADDVYSAFRLMKLAPKPIGVTHICEIGAGLGGTAFECITAGFGRYTIIDLPIILVVQAWYLAKLLGPEQIHLFGERNKGKKVSLRPYWEFYDENIQFDMAFNRDSMPEIPDLLARDYIKEIARRKIPFLSINQEAQAGAGPPGVMQLWIHDLVRQQGDLRCASRHRHWTREGYVEEFFIPKNAGQSAVKNSLISMIKGLLNGAR